MLDKTAITLSYYNEKSEQYAQDTQHVDFSKLQNIFLDHLKPGDIIIDLGCGAGRDSKVFINKGYQVIAVDGSKELASIAEELIGQKVICETFQQFTPSIVVAGIWACASLLHLTQDEIKDVVIRLSKKLKPGGVFYMSFKLGNFSGYRNGRFFTDMTREKFYKMVQDIPDIELILEKTSTDVRPGRENEYWLNIILKKQ